MKISHNNGRSPRIAANAAELSPATRKHAELIDTYVDGRWRVVVDLFQDPGDELRQHDDPWISTMLAMLAKPNEPDNALSGPQKDMRGALRLFWGDALLRQLVEARLLAQEGVAKVARRCSLTEGVVEAFSAMFFNAAGLDGQRRFSVTERHFPPTGPQSVPHNLGQLLKQLALNEGEPVVEEIIGALLRVTGRSFADGMTEEDLFYDRQDAQVRLSVAMNTPILSDRHKRSREAYRRAFGPQSRGRTWERRTRLQLAVLATVRIPGTLRQELRELRGKQEAGV